MATYLPTDTNDNPIPVMRFQQGGAHKVNATTGASARNSSAFGGTTRVISVYADTDVYITFGDSTASAASTDHFFPAGLYYDVSIGDDAQAKRTHVAVLAKDTDGTVYISEKE